MSPRCLGQRMKQLQDDGAQSAMKFNLINNMAKFGRRKKSLKRNTIAANMSQIGNSFYNRTASILDGSRNLRGAGSYLIASPDPGHGRRSKKPLDIMFKKRNDDLDSVHGYFPESEGESASSLIQDEAQDEEFETNEIEEEQAEEVLSEDVLVDEEEIRQHFIQESEPEEALIDDYFNKEIFGMKHTLGRQSNTTSQREAHETIVHHNIGGGNQEGEEESEENANHASVRVIATGTEYDHIPASVANTSIGVNTSFGRYDNRHKRRTKRHSDDNDYDDGNIDLSNVKRRRHGGRSHKQVVYWDSSSDSERLSQLPGATNGYFIPVKSAKTLKSLKKRRKKVVNMPRRNKSVGTFIKKKDDAAMEHPSRHVKESSRKIRQLYVGDKNLHFSQTDSDSDGMTPHVVRAKLLGASPSSSRHKGHRGAVSKRIESPRKTNVKQLGLSPRRSNREQPIANEASDSEDDDDMDDDERYSRLARTRTMYEDDQVYHMVQSPKKTELGRRKSSAPHQTSQFSVRAIVSPRKSMSQTTSYQYEIPIDRVEVQNSPGLPGFTEQHRRSAANARRTRTTPRDMTSPRKSMSRINSNAVLQKISTNENEIEGHFGSGRKSIAKKSPRKSFVVQQNSSARSIISSPRQPEVLDAYSPGLKAGTAREKPGSIIKPRRSSIAKRPARKSVQFLISTPRNDVSMHPDMSEEEMPNMTSDEYQRRSSTTTRKDSLGPSAQLQAKQTDGDSAKSQPSTGKRRKTSHRINPKRRTGSKISRKSSDQEKNVIADQISPASMPVHETPESIKRSSKKRRTPLSLKKSKPRLSIQETPPTSVPRAHLQSLDKWPGPSPVIRAGSVAESPVFFESLPPARQETPRRACMRDAVVPRSIHGTPSKQPQDIMNKQTDRSIHQSPRKDISRSAGKLQSKRLSLADNAIEGINTLPGRSDSDSPQAADDKTNQQQPNVLKKQKKRRACRLNPPKRRKPTKANTKIDGLDISESQRRRILEEEENDGPRRGKRTRIAPVKHWKGGKEYVEYERRLSGLTITNVVRDADESPVKKITKKNKKKPVKSKPTHVESESNYPDDEEMTVEVNPVQLVKGEDDSLVEMRVIHTPGMLDLKAPPALQGRPQTPNILVHRYFSQSIFCAGLLAIAAKSGKGLQLLKNDSMFFIIIEGVVDVTIESTTTRLGKNCTFFVPSGNVYNIQNVSNQEARLHFIQLKKNSQE